ncbi:hypothetical protein GCM10027048_45160 [Hymenobacter coalescens]
MLEAPALECAPISGAAKAEQSDALADGGSGPAAVPVSPTSRQLIYKADVRIKVRDLARATARVDSVVRRSGSWVGAAAQTRSDEEWRQEMTIRVRPELFTTLLTGLSALGTVERKALTSEDVTVEHADVAARLRTKRALEQRYIGLLSQAKKVSEVLEIEAKIGQVREEIESAESRFKALNDQVAYSTITLKLYQPLALPAPDAPVISFGSRVVEAFYDGWQLVTGLCIGLVSLWPLLLVGGALFWLIRRWRQRRMALQQ